MGARELGRQAAGTAVAASTVVVALLATSLSDKAQERRQTGSGTPVSSQDCPSPGAEGCETGAGQETPPPSQEETKQPPSASRTAPPSRTGQRSATGGDESSGGDGKPWQHPIKGRATGAAFGNAGGRWSRGHTGVDFPAPSGTPVAAAGHGKVVKAGPGGGGDGKAYGNAIVIKHAGGTYSQYAHLMKIDVKVGDTVRAGQRIALSGNTGNSSGPHLHFEIRTTPNYGSAVDPVKFLRGKGVST